MTLLLFNKKGTVPLDATQKSPCYPGPCCACGENGSRWSGQGGALGDWATLRFANRQIAQRSAEAQARVMSGPRQKPFPYGIWCNPKPKPQAAQQHAAKAISKAAQAVPKPVPPPAPPPLHLVLQAQAKAAQPVLPIRLEPRPPPTAPPPALIAESELAEVLEILRLTPRKARQASVPKAALPAGSKPPPLLAALATNVQPFPGEPARPYPKVESDAHGPSPGSSASDVRSVTSTEPPKKKARKSGRRWILRPSAAPTAAAPAAPTAAPAPAAAPAAGPAATPVAPAAGGTEPVARESNAQIRARLDVRPRARRER